MSDLNILTEEVLKAHDKVKRLKQEVSKVLVGQSELLDRLFIGLLLEGHILIEGVPGLAKTTAVKAFADVISASFQRVQFTPDLLPADLLGTQIYNPKTQEFSIKKGPLFHNVILADEINRAPAKVQSALLEAMQERQITIGEESFKLQRPFLVLATQNPLEQEGTYPLPEAQLDRFLFKLHVGYPNRQDEKLIMERFSHPQTDSLKPVLQIEEIQELQNLVHKIYVDEKIHNYIVDLVFASREPWSLKKKLSPYLQFGASPRASINLLKASRAVAFMNSRAYVVPQDVKSVASDILRHRLILTYEAEAEGLTTDKVIQMILDQVDVP